MCVTWISFVFHLVSDYWGGKEASCVREFVPAFIDLFVYHFFVVMAHHYYYYYYYAMID